MTPTRATPNLDRFADALRDTFPPARDAPVTLTLVRLLAHGRPVSGAAAATAAGHAEDEIRVTLDSWPNVHYDDDQRIVALGGLTLQPTTHSLELRGERLHAWCAWDTLFLPALLDATATVTSTCPVTRSRVELIVSRDRITGRTPEHVFVSYPPIGETDTADIIGSFCRHVHFLAGEHAAEAWLAKQPRGQVLGLDDALELGHRAVTTLVPPPL